MKKFTAISLLTVSLAACGASNKPEAADVKAAMDEVFKSCKNIKVANVKKINGYVHPRLESSYVVEHEYTITYKKPADYANLRKVYAEEKKMRNEGLGAALEQAQKKAYFYLNVQQEALKDGDREKAAQAMRDYAEANDQARELSKKSENFFQSAKVYGNVAVNINRWYFEGCDSDRIKPFVPASYVAAPPHGFILVLNIGLSTSDDDGWFEIGDIPMKGEVSLRKTDNGWRIV